MVHQESTGSGGRGVVPGQVVDGSWKAGRGRHKGIKSQKERMPECEVVQEPAKILKQRD
jgi:hypothetical protein